MSTVAAPSTLHAHPFRPRGQGQRWIVATAALIAAVAHVPVIGPHLDEAPYMGILFIVLTVACLGIAGAISVRDSAALYAAAALTCGLAVLGYAATRLVAFPMLADDVGNWLEPLGVWSVVSETVVVLAAGSALVRRPAAPGASPAVQPA
jgi:hypothetical protein